MGERLESTAELRSQLEQAEQDLEAIDAKIAQVTDNEENAEFLADLDQKFDEQEAEVARLKKAVERRQRIEVLRGDMPVGKNAKGDTPKVEMGKEPLTYRRLKEGGKHSFFQDLYWAKRGNPGAQSRLARHEREMAVETRELDTTANDGGEFLPPLHLQQEWAELARAGRAYANALNSRTLPSVGMSFTVPRISPTGTSTAIQATENTAVSDTDAETDEITIPVRTIAGKQEMSQQAFERSDPGLDEVIAADLAASHAVTLDTQLLNGSGASGQVEGVLQNSNIETVTYTDSTPTVAEIYPKVADAINRVHTLRFMSPDVIFMHPRRWAWFLSALDTQDRPLITPYAPSNALARFDAVAPENVVGNLLGLTVIVDPNLPATNGAGTNEDVVIVTRAADHMFFESGLRTKVDEISLANQLSVRLVVFSYVAYTSDRYPKATSSIEGTGLAAPSF